MRMPMLSLFEPDVIALYTLSLSCRLTATGLFLALVAFIPPLFSKLAL
jgi:hypothetical protein